LDGGLTSDSADVFFDNFFGGWQFFKRFIGQRRIGVSIIWGNEKKIAG
jgi:hypothetical protein